MIYPFLRVFTLSLLCFGLTCCQSSTSTPNDSEAEEPIAADEMRIVSLNGSLTEIVCGLGFCDNLVGVDVTSTYPRSVEELPDMGYHRLFSAEGILSLEPTLILAVDKELNPSLKKQLNDAQARLVTFERTFSIDGAKTLIKEVATVLEAEGKADTLIAQIDRDITVDTSSQNEEKPKALFIYARGAGSLTIAGENTPMFEMIKLAGAEPAVSGFEGYKPLSAEFLVEANPDYVILFERGIESLGGMEGLLAIPGMEQTTAGKEKNVIEMDGLLLSGFTPRVGQALSELHTAIHE